MFENLFTKEPYVPEKTFSQKNGEELTTISATLGHSSTQVTTVYLSVDHSRLKECCIPMPKLHSPHYSLED